MDTENLEHEGCDCTRTTARDEELKKALISRLNRIEGQIRGIRTMIEEDKYCDDVLSQIAAARSALDSAAKVLLESHIRGCVVRDIKNDREQTVDELLRTIGRLLK